MNGYEKTAILFGELGAGACEEVLAKLNLSTAQIKKNSESNAENQELWGKGL